MPKDARLLAVIANGPHRKATELALAKLCKLEAVDDPSKAAGMMQRRRYAVLLCDQWLAAMSGLDLCSLAREISPPTARIVMAPLGSREELLSAESDGTVHRVLMKPVRPEVLQGAVRMGILYHQERARRMALEGTALSRSDITDINLAQSKIAHEVRNMLLPVSRGVDSIAEATRALADVDPGRADALLDSVATVGIVVEQLGELMQRLARHDGDLKRARLSDVVSSVVRWVRTLLSEQTRIDADFQAEGYVYMSPAALAQVAMNLLLNAKRAVSELPLGSILVRVAQAEQRLELHVQDNGPGFPDALLEEGGRRWGRSGGVGHGLSVVRALCAAADASLELTNNDHGALAVVRWNAWTAT